MPWKLRIVRAALLSLEVIFGLLISIIVFVLADSLYYRTLRFGINGADHKPCGTVHHSDSCAGHPAGLADLLNPWNWPQLNVSVKSLSSHLWPTT